MGLEEYRLKRDFTRTPEPPPGRRKRKKTTRRAFVVHKHGARSLHYDLRLEFGGALKSWAVPKGPSLNPGTRRLAVRVEDHPLEYGTFEGNIPAGEYGAGPVMVWDAGEWTPEGSVSKALERGSLAFTLNGSKLRGAWRLVRTSGAAGDSRGHENWLLIKRKDAEARPLDYDVLEERPESVVSGRTLDEIAQDARNGAPKSKKRNDPGTTTRSGKTARSRSSASARSDVSTDARIPGARPKALPKFVKPQLPTLVDSAPSGDDWLHELKFDGYRLLCRIDNGDVRLLTRSGKDWTDRFRTIARAAASLPVTRALLDGEAVVVRRDGTTDFQALQNRVDQGGDGDVVYYAFDLLHLDGQDLSPVPQIARKDALEALLASASPASVSDDSGAEPIRYSVHVVGRGPEVFRQACRLGAEGIVAKRVDRPYREGRSKDWLKVKCLAEQEFVVVGWTDPRGSRAGLGSLLLGYYDDGGELRYAGRVGTGFTAQSLRELRRELDRWPRREPAVTPAPRITARGVHWVEPRLVVEVAFTDWTRDGLLRHPSFKGRREDRDPREVRRELPSTGADVNRTQPHEGDDRAPRTAEPATASRGRAGTKRPTKADPSTRAKPRSRTAREPVSVAGVRLTHPDRVYFPEIGVTKHELAEYYQSVSDAIMPYIVDRLLTLVRCPDGHTGECFYQKHVMPGFPKSIRRVPVREASRTRNYFSVNDISSLIYLVQIGSLEFHTWGARTDRLDRPDVLIFDLDPGPGVSWAAVVEAAHTVRDLLGKVGLETFPKTTGGKGIHVVAPIIRRHTWDEVKEFARAVAARIARADPSGFTDRVAMDQRKGRIYVDYLRNARGATAVAVFSTRARSGATVAVPLSWDELTARLDPAGFTVRTVPDVVAERTRAWADYARVRQSITVDMKREFGVG